MESVFSDWDDVRFIFKHNTVELNILKNSERPLSVFSNDFAYVFLSKALPILPI